MEKRHFREPIPPIHLTPLESAWLAGLLEGEGSFGLDARSKKRYLNSTAPPMPYIHITMTDQDVLERVARLVNKKLLFVNRPTVSGLQVYKVHIGDRPTVAYVLEKIYPYMGKRRQEQINLCLQSLALWSDWKIQREKK